MSEEQYAALALEFLQRCELKGAEVGAFVSVRNWLTDKAQTGPQSVEVNDEPAT